MKRTLMLTLAVSLLTALSAMAAVDGAWTASSDSKRPDRFHMQLTYGRHNSMGTSFTLTEFTNLTGAQINATTSTPVNFEMRREAGTISYEGSFRNGRGAGQFTFAPNRGFFDTLRSLGVNTDLEHSRRRERDDEETLFVLALHDVSSAFIKSMQAEGFKVSLEKYLEMRIFNITPAYIREMRELGFRNLDVDELVASAIHRVTPDYVRRMRAAGWNLSLDELQSTAIHGATPEFAEEMKKYGYGNLSIDDLVSFRIHRVTPEFITELRELGYKNISADDLVSMRIHRVTPEFIRELAAAGYRNVPVDKLVEMRIHNIDAKMLKALSDS